MKFNFECINLMSLNINYYHYEDTVSANKQDNEVDTGKYTMAGNATICTYTHIHNSIPVLASQYLKYREQTLPETIKVAARLIL